MSTSSHSTALGAHAPADARHETSAFGHTLLKWLADILARIQASIADRRMRHRLADLSDPLLRDIGIADDEIPRIRACERFTPRAWTNVKGSSRRCQY